MPPRGPRQACLCTAVILPELPGVKGRGSRAQTKRSLGAFENLTNPRSSQPTNDNESIVTILKLLAAGCGRPGAPLRSGKGVGRGVGADPGAAPATSSRGWGGSEGLQRPPRTTGDILAPIQAQHLRVAVGAEGTGRPTPRLPQTARGLARANRPRRAPAGFQSASFTRRPAP